MQPRAGPGDARYESYRNGVGCSSHLDLQGCGQHPPGVAPQRLRLAVAAHLDAGLVGVLLDEALPVAVKPRSRRTHVGILVLPQLVDRVTFGDSSLGIKLRPSQTRLTRTGSEHLSWWTSEPPGTVSSCSAPPGPTAGSLWSDPGVPALPCGG